MHIVEGHLGDQTNLRIADALLGGLNIGIGGFDIAAEAAKDVEFPHYIQAYLKQILIACPWCGAGIAGGMRPLIGSRTVHCGPQAASDDTAHGARLAQTGFGQLQVQIRVDRLFHQGGDLWVIKLLPPVGQLSRL